MTEKLNYQSVKVADGLKGQIRVPGDKSISHRSVMFASIANGKSKISGLLEGEDVLATLEAFKAMGVEVSGPKDGRLSIKGVGKHGLKEPQSDLDMGNSGTAMRLMAGILSAQKFPSKLVGDESLSKRPMRRVTVPLTAMGARCVADEQGCPPIHIRGVEKLEPITYKLPVASAQVKSAVLLAGLYAEGTTSVTEPAPTRDHTERMLMAFGYPCEVEKINELSSTISVAGGGELTATNIDVPGDISSAAFFMVAAAIIPGSRVTLKHVGINPTRTGIIEVLKMMGANIELLKPRDVGGEPVADIRISAGPLKAIDMPAELVPLAIDEIPIISVAAACANGTTRISGAEELRHKESDRISSVVEGLRQVGIEVTEHKDGMEIVGGNFSGGVVESADDHRIAMAFAIAGAVSANPITIQDCQNVATSFPNFVELATTIGVNLQVEQTVD